MNAYAVQMHLHGSMSEGTGSCLAHDWMAAAAGSVDVIWWTDHDFRVANFAKVTGHSCDAFEEFQPIPNRKLGAAEPTTPLPVRWRPAGAVGTTRTTHAAPTPLASAEAMLAGAAGGTAEIAHDVVHSGTGSLRVTLPSGGPDERVCLFELDSRARHDTYPLVTRPVVRLAIYPAAGVGPQGSILVRFLLSEQPPDLRQAQVTYVLGGADGTNEGAGGQPAVDGLAATIPCRWTPGEWNTFTFDLAADVERLDVPGGLDNALHRLQIGVASRGPSVVAYFDTLQFEVRHKGPGVLDLHRELLRSLPTRVHHLVGLETSYYGRHIGAFGSRVPIPDYERLDRGGWSTEQLIEHIHHYGGLAAINHPLWSDLAAVTELVQRRVYGADLLEVAWGPWGWGPRLLLWDELSRAGVVVTGIGTSDAHTAARGWVAADGRPVDWVTRIWANSVEESDLLASLRRGNVFFADPSQFRGTIQFSGPDRAEMGDVLVVPPSAGETPELTARCTGLRPGDLIAWLCNGNLVHAAYAEGDAYAEAWRPPAPVADVQAIRLQVQRPGLAGAAFGGAIACSNPIYLSTQPLETTHRMFEVANGEVSRDD